MIEKAQIIYDYFNLLYPDAHCELTHQNTFELLVAVMLSAQTTDKSVNKITPKLFEKYPTPQLMAKAPLDDLENLIRQIGLYRNKAKNLHALSTALVEQFDGKVPAIHSQLTTLPGVGRKTANVVLSVGFDIPAFAVDTHVERVAKRLKLAYQNDSVLIVEKKIMKKFPIETWNKLHHQFIFFGRYFCTAKNPNCTPCNLQPLCRLKSK